MLKTNINSRCNSEGGSGEHTTKILTNNNNLGNDIKLLKIEKDTKVRKRRKSQTKFL